MSKELDDGIMDKWLTHLKVAEERFDEKNQISTPKIQRVPYFLKQKDRFVKYCTPKLISFGPIHHKAPHLKQAEELKLIWTSKFVTEYSQKMNKDTKQVTKVLLKKIEGNMEELKKLFTEDALEGYDDCYLTWMFFVDGCSLLYFMENADEGHPKVLNLKLDQLLYMWRDMLLLENQLPMRLLKLLLENGVANLDNLLFNFDTLGRYKQVGMNQAWMNLRNYVAIHILDHYRSLLIGPSMEDINTIPNQAHGLERFFQIVSDEMSSDFTYKNVRDLKAEGIGVKPCTLDREHPLAWSSVHFFSSWLGGELKLPRIVFNDNTPYLFHNLVAFEMCPDFQHKYECCSFISFMDSLIDNAEDVKELRLSGTLQNLLGSDEDLANLINDLGNELPTKMYSNKRRTSAVASSKKYINVKRQIEKHYSTKWRRWLAQGYNTYFGFPWSIIAFFTASVALVLTSIQTWFTVHPKH